MNLDKKERVVGMMRVMSENIFGIKILYA